MDYTLFWSDPEFVKGAPVRKSRGGNSEPIRNILTIVVADRRAANPMSFPCLQKALLYLYR
jgi:hypothetical protein